MLVDTARFHLAAWRRIADELGFEFDDEVGEALKGVGREAALLVLTRSGGVELDAATAERTAQRKNRYYNESLATLDASAFLPGAEAALGWLHGRGIPIALASASRNARTILVACGIEDRFDAIVDGTSVPLAKPDPAVFLAAAAAIGVDPSEAIVFEDAIAGVDGALRAGCRVIGVGDPAVLLRAELTVPDLTGVDWPALMGRA
ncbi:beta-phosphoglucomutase [Pseudolysinimonas yzui]|uniref:Beta-phosphoglucomutase n=1 Tax=Pseudolysinimonas yzui TaxID=2708254 RepID=A0A8J3M4H1_9MICO|nr:beta-phosphoglucomutase [Pseudolysinimonas yzui]